MELYIDHDNNSRKNRVLINSFININNLKVKYSEEGKTVLDIDELSISRGDRVSVIGSSGAGKTTLLKAIIGFINPYKGQISLNNTYNSNSNNKGRIGFIFQDFNLIDRVSVYENVVYGRLGKTNPIKSLFGFFNDKDKEIAIDAVKEVNLIDKLNQRTDTLSGGELQRVAIARVIAQEAEIILADEPVSNLDPALAHEILNLLVEISSNHGVTLIMNLHQPSLAKRYTDRIIGLKQGKIVFDDDSSALNNTELKEIYGYEFGSSIMFEHKK